MSLDFKLLLQKFKEGEVDEKELLKLIKLHCEECKECDIRAIAFERFEDAILVEEGDGKLYWNVYPEDSEIPELCRTPYNHLTSYDLIVCKTCGLILWSSKKELIGKKLNLDEFEYDVVIKKGLLE